MNEHETIDLLIRRRETVGIAYGQQTIAHWTEELGHLAYDDVLGAFHALVAEGENNITVPALRRRLISTRPPTADNYMPPPPVEVLPRERIREIVAAGIAEGRRDQARREAADPVYAERMRHHRRVRGIVAADVDVRVLADSAIDVVEHMARSTDGL